MSQYGPDLSSVILHGLNSGASSYDQGMALSLHMAEIHRQLAQEDAARRANLAEWDRFNPAPLAAAPLQPQIHSVPNPGYGQEVQNQGIAQQAVAGIAGAVNDAGGQGNPGIQANLAMLQGAVPQPRPMLQQETPPPPVTMPDPELEAHHSRRAAFAAAPASTQQHLLGGYQEFDRQSRMADFQDTLQQKKVDRALATIASAAEAGLDERHSPFIAGLKTVLGSLGYQMPLRTNRLATSAAVQEAYHQLGIQPPTDPTDLAAAAGGDFTAMARLNDKGHMGALMYLQHQASARQPVSPEMIAGLQSEDPAIRARAIADYQNAAHTSPPPALLRKAPTFTAEMVQAAYPTLPPESAQALADASNQQGRLVRPMGIALHPGGTPTREEAEARAADILRDAGVQDPEHHPSFGILAYKIERGKDIDQKTATRMFGDPGLGNRIVLTTLGAMAKDASTRMHTADAAVNVWNREQVKMGSRAKPLPAQLEAEQRNARRAYDEAHDRWEKGLETGQAPASVPPGQPAGQPPAPVKAPAGPQAAPSPAPVAAPAAVTPVTSAPASEDEIAAAEAAGAQTDEEVAEFIRRRRQQP